MGIFWDSQRGKPQESPFSLFRGERSPRTGIKVLQTVQWIVSLNLLAKILADDKPRAINLDHPNAHASLDDLPICTNRLWNHGFPLSPLHYNPRSLHLNHLDWRAGWDEVSFGHDIDIKLADLGQAGGPQHRLGCSDLAEHRGG